MNTISNWSYCDSTSSTKKTIGGIVVAIWFLCTSFSTVPAHSTEMKLVDFSGTWTLNIDKTDFGKLSRHSPALTINIRQDADSLAIERTSKRGNGEVSNYIETFSMKGGSAESMIKTTKKTASIEWSSDGMSLTEKASYKDYSNDMQYSGTETWTLLDNGQTLSIDRQDLMPDGNTYSTKIVYDKSAMKTNN